MASWNDRSWPLRRWLCDRLIGDNAYTRNVVAIGDGDILRNEQTGEWWRIGSPTSGRVPSEFPFKPVKASGDAQEFTSDGIPLFDQEAS